MKTQENNILYALHWRNKLLGTFKWLNSNPGMNLQGWRPPKKVYFTLGMARSGATHLPREIIDEIEIVEYLPGKVIKAPTLKEIENNRAKREIASLKKSLKYCKAHTAQNYYKEKDIIKKIEELQVKIS